MFDGDDVMTREEADAEILAAIVRRKVRIQGEIAVLRADVAVCEGLLRKFEAAIRERQGEVDRPPAGARLN